jgi:hypothetical protein
MKLLSNKKIEKESHNLEVKIYEEFILVEVTIPFELYTAIIQRLGYGKWDSERYILSKFTQDVFEVEYASKIFFSNHQEYYDKLCQYGIEALNTDNNLWFRMVMLPISGNNYEEDLKNHINYIKKCSERYVSNSIEGKILIANKYLDKL